MRQAFKLIWQCDRKAVSLKLFYTFLGSVLPLVNLYVLKLLVDSVANVVSVGDSQFAIQDLRLLVYALLFCAIALTGRLIGVFNTVNNDKLTQKLTDYINDLIQRQSIRLDISYYDNSDYHDTFHRAQSEAAFRPIRILENIMTVFGSAVSLAGVVVMLCAVSWQVVAIMVVAAFPAFCVRLSKSRRIYRFRRETTETVRRSNYYGQLLSNRRYAKEVRAFGLASFIREQYVEMRKMLVDQLLAISHRLAVFDAVTAVVESVALCLVLLGLIKPVVGGVITLGSFVMLFEAFRRGQGYLNSLVNGVSGLYEHRLFISNLFEFLELTPSIESPANPLPFPEKVESVQFDNVTFTYPAMNSPVLRNFSLTAKIGEVTLLNGENGSGKTTVLKLLLRLYDPEKGSVRINGIDIRQFDVNELRSNISVIFQDYVPFYFSARENIVFGDIEHGDDAERLAESIRRADAGSVLQSLGKGLDTQLGRMFSEGEELSMGQWQRIALARQLYSHASVLFFDEATAWMDSGARKVFEQTVDELKGTHVIILVSHREL